MSTLTSVTNLYSLNVLNSLGKTQSSLNKSLQRLSSGEAISSAMDNPSGFSISEKMRDYIIGLKRASSNAQNGISYLQTAEGATSEITSMLQRMRELSVESANGVYTSNDRQELQKEMDQLKAEIDRISASTEFNTKKLLNGESTGAWNSGTDRISAIITGNVADGNYDISLGVEPGKNQVMTSQIMTIKNGKLGAQVEASGTSNIGSVRNPDNIAPSKGANYSVTVADRITAGDSMELISSYKQDGGIFSTGPIGTAVSTNESGYMQIEFTEDNDEANLAGTKYRIRFISAETGKEGEWVDFTTAANDSMSGTYTSNGFSVTFQIPVTTGAASAVKNGDKLFYSVSDNKDMVTADALLASGGGTVQVDRNGIKGPFITYDGVNSLTKADNKDGVDDSNNVTLFLVDMDTKTGEIKKGSFTLGFKENSSLAGQGMTLSGVATIEVRGSGEPATATTKLGDIANFTDADGNDLLYTTQELNIYGNSRTASVYLEKNDTVETFRDKLIKAITKDLGLGSGNAAVDKQLAQYINNDGGKGNKAVPGTFVIQSGVVGDTGKISLIGNEKLITALGLQTVQEAENSSTKVTAKNNRTGVIEGERTTSDSRAKNIIPGLDIAFDARASVGAKWIEETGRIEFAQTASLDDYNMNVHVVDARTKIQIGTMKGENLDVSIPEINTKALGISDTVITTQEDSQKAITALDAALSKVVSIRSTMGSHVSRLESAMTNLETTVVNVTASDSRIRDADVAAETSNMAMAQLMYQANISMLAQANQLPGVVFSLLNQQ